MKRPSTERKQADPFEIVSAVGLGYRLSKHQRSTTDRHRLQCILIPPVDTDNCPPSRCAERSAKDHVA